MKEVSRRRSWFGLVLILLKDVGKLHLLIFADIRVFHVILICQKKDQQESVWSVLVVIKNAMLKNALHS